MTNQLFFELLQSEIEEFLSSYPVTFIGHSMENWELDKATRCRQDFSDAIVKGDSLWTRLRQIGNIHPDYAPLCKRLLGAKNSLRHEFEKYEMYGLGIKGEPREPRPIKPVVSPRKSPRHPS